jgi:hypothetical protein
VKIGCLTGAAFSIIGISYNYTLERKLISWNGLHLDSSTVAVVKTGEM